MVDIVIPSDKSFRGYEIVEDDELSSLGAPLWMELDLDNLIDWMSSEYNLKQNGINYTVPRFGVYSTLLAKTPVFIYGDPRLIHRWGRTAFTDGIHIFICADFYKQIVEDEDASNGKEKGVVPLVLHELGHILDEDCYRLRQYDPILANIAQDYIRNTTLRLEFPSLIFAKSLVENAVGFAPGDLEKYPYLSQEVIAEDLYIKGKKKEQEEEQKLKVKGQRNDQKQDESRSQEDEDDSEEYEEDGENEADDEFDNKGSKSKKSKSGAKSKDLSNDDQDSSENEDDQEDKQEKKNKSASNKENKRQNNKNDDSDDSDYDEGEDEDEDSYDSDSDYEEEDEDEGEDGSEQDNNGKSDSKNKNQPSKNNSMNDSGDAEGEGDTEEDSEYNEEDSNSDPEDNEEDSDSDGDSESDEEDDVDSEKQDGESQSGESAHEGGSPQPGDGGGSPLGAPVDENGNIKFGAKGDIHHHSLKDVIKALEECGLDRVLEKLNLPRSNDEKAIEEKEQEGIDVKNQSVFETDVKRHELSMPHFPGKHSLDCAMERIKSVQKGKLSWKLKIINEIWGSGFNFKYNNDVVGDIYYVDELIDVIGMNLYMGQIMPFKSQDVVAIIIDTSGSVGQKDLEDIVPEIIEMKLAARGSSGAYEVVVFSADTVLRGEPVEINETNVHEVLSGGLQIFGRGGTSLERAIQQTVKSKVFKEKKIKSLIYFTDLGDSPPRYENLGLDPDTSMTYIAVPSISDFAVEAFAKEVEHYADVIKIKEGVEVDLSITPRIKQEVNMLLS